MLDLRLPVGIFFLLVGAILGIDGLVQPVRTPGVDFTLNLVWGAFLFLFGAVMTLFGWLGERKAKNGATRTSSTAPPN